MILGWSWTPDSWHVHTPWLLRGFSRLVSPCLQLSSHLPYVCWYCQPSLAWCAGILAPCSEESTYSWRHCVCKLLCMTSAITLFFFWPGTKATTYRAPCRWKSLIHWGATWYTEGTVSDIATATPDPCSPQLVISHFGFGGSEPCFSSKDVITSVTRMPEVGFWRHEHKIEFIWRSLYVQNSTALVPLESKPQWLDVGKCEPKHVKTKIKSGLFAYP
jgi:hypothetical protein